MSKATIHYEGKEYIAVRYWTITIGQYFVTKDGNVIKSAIDDEEIRLIVKPVPVEHIFGGVVYEEGERRNPYHEYYLEVINGTAFLGYANSKALHPYTILDPVRTIHE